jgi:hypothetical protein
VRDIAAFFDLALTRDAETLDRVFANYSKDRQGCRHFEEDAARKRRLATRALNAAAEKWAMRAYSDLRARGLW